MYFGFPRFPYSTFSLLTHPTRTEIILEHKEIVFTSLLHDDDVDVRKLLNMSLRVKFGCEHIANWVIKVGSGMGRTLKKKNIFLLVSGWVNIEHIVAQTYPTTSLAFMTNKPCFNEWHEWATFCKMWKRKVEKIIKLTNRENRIYSDELWKWKRGENVAL